MTLASINPDRAGIVRQLTRGSAFLLHTVHDPGLVSLRRGLRAALIMPLLLAGASVLSVGQSAATFLVFGSMALLVFADFGGPTRSRVQAYVTTVIVGVPLLVIGTLASGTVWTAVAATAAVGFAVAGVGVLGGYFLTAQTALLLAFVLAVANPGSFDALLPRIMGWCAAGVAAILAGWLLWPRSSHMVLCTTAASVIRAVLAIVAAPEQEASSGNLRQLEAAARQKLAALRTGFVVAQRRPAGATRRNRALAELASDLERALEFAGLARNAGPDPPLAEASGLIAAVVRALDASAGLLEHRGAIRDVEPLVVARDAHRAALDAWAAQQLTGGAAPETVQQGLAAAHPLRLMSYVSLTIARDAHVAVGLPPTGLDEDGIGGLRTTFLEEFAPSSIWLRNSLRTALGLAVAVLVSGSLAVPYAFWVVLGTLSALRGSVSATGRSALQALGGTAVGVLIAVPFVGATGGDQRLLWIVLPLLVFLAAYTPAAVHFVVGQVAFSVLVVVLFNILAPTGWQIGLVRVEDAALGVSVSGLVGLMLWPRGARGQLRSALAALYLAGAASLSASFRSLLAEEGESADAARAVRNRAHAETIRAEEVFEQFLNERGRQVPPVEVWATLLSGGKRLLLIGEILDWLAEHGYAAAGGGTPATAIGSLASDAIANVARLADEVRAGRSLRVTPRHDGSAERRAAALAALAVPGIAASSAALRSAIGLVSTAEWLAQLETLAQELEAPVAETRAAALLPWWR
jgi:uncharacterized membrane protein YccC